MAELITRFTTCRYCGRTGGPPCGLSADERAAHRAQSMTAEAWARIDEMTRICAPYSPDLGVRTTCPPTRETRRG